jgi:hypothetical protein
MNYKKIKIDYFKYYIDYKSLLKIIYTKINFIILYNSFY